MARKAFHYMEVTFPQSVIDQHPGAAPIGIMKELLDQYIAETDDKNGKIVKEFVFNEIRAYTWNGNMGAYSFEFINERNRQTYFTARANYTAWLEEKGIVTSYELSHDIPMETVDSLIDGEFVNSTYYNTAKIFIFNDIPEQRGFQVEALPA